MLLSLLHQKFMSQNPVSFSCSFSQLIPLDSFVPLFCLPLRMQGSETHATQSREIAFLCLSGDSSSVEVVLIYIDILHKMSLTAPALVLIHDEARKIKGSKKKARGVVLYHFQDFRFFCFSLATFLESKIRDEKTNVDQKKKCKSECHEEKKEVAFPDTMTYSELANFSAAQLGTC